MEEDRLVIRGRTYTAENLHQLPEDLNCFKVTSKEDEHCLGFFGGLNPLSNLHTAPFTVDEIEYISSEQFIQAKKAEFFNDRNAYDRIMGSATSLDCKKNSRLIRGFDRNKWEGVAKHVCYPGIRAKFQQNADLLNTLLYKTGQKKIVESTNDRLWGMGIPLNKVECLDQSKWTGQGILGEILKEIRRELRPGMPTIPPYHPVGDNSYFTSTMPCTVAPGASHHQQIPFNTAAWNAPGESLPVYTPLTVLDCGLNTANLLPPTANMGPPATCKDTAHTKPARTPANMAIQASLAINNNNNDNSEPELILQAESTLQNEVEMIETGPT